MKILITTDLFTTETNGVVTSIKNLREELCKRGHEVRVLTVSDSLSSHAEDNVFYINSVSLEMIYPNVRMPVLYRHALIRQLIRWQPDIIHSQCEFFSFQFARYISKQTGAPIVHTYHTLYEQYVSYAFLSERLGLKAVSHLSRQRLKYVDCVVAPTRKVEKTLRGYGLLNEIRVIPSGISLKQHLQKMTSEEQMQRRLQLGIQPHQKVLINLGRLGTEKNLEELMHYFAKARTAHPDLIFLIVGDGPARSNLETLARELNVSQYVIFTGMVSPAEVHKYYQLGDIFVSASTSETQGLTYIEASANGLPLLCRQDPCLDEVLLPGQNGFAYTQENEFLSRLDDMLSDPHWLATAGEKGRSIATQFDQSHFGSAVEKMYRAVLNRYYLLSA